MSKNPVTIFAATNFRNSYQKFGIKQDDRRRHMYLIGKTGMGKSVLQENMIINDIQAGRGVAVVDPHGDLVEKVVKFIPRSRIDDVIYFNPSDIDHPIAFNIVETVDPQYRHLVASGLIGIFQKLWADSWGPRLEYILRNAILAVLDNPGSTLMSVTRMLSDKPFRKQIIDNIQDPVVKAFWVNEFAGYADKFASEAVSPIQNKVGQFLSSSLIRNIVGQTKSNIDIRKLMDEKKILLMNLSKGHIGEDNSALLGAMMITKIQLAAMSRVDVIEEEREDFHLYVDEFQNFATGSFANILSEARKYRLNLIMAHQYIAQLSEDVWAAVQGNVGTLVVFRVGAADAEVLIKEFEPQYLETDLVNLPKYNFYTKLMIDGVASHPFSAIGLPPRPVEEETRLEKEVIALSRKKYADDRESIEEMIMEWHGMTAGESGPESINAPKKFQPQSPNNFSKSSFNKNNNNQKNNYDSGNSTKESIIPKKPVNPTPLAKRFYNEEPEKVEEKIKDENIPEDSGISFSDALSQGAVDFHGRKIEHKKSSYVQEKRVPVSIDKSKKKYHNNTRNGSLREGQKVDINTS